MTMGGVGALNQHDGVRRRLSRTRRRALGGRGSGINPCACRPLTLLLRTRRLWGGADIRKIRRLCILKSALGNRQGPIKLTFAPNVSAASAALRPSRAWAAVEYIHCLSLSLTHRKCIVGAALEKT